MVNPKRYQSGFLMVELLVALALVVAVLLPFAYSFAAERRLALASYQRAVAMEIVDGEMEVLAAGEWRAFPPGTHDYHIQAGAATNLPPGRFMLTVQPGKVRLHWQPDRKDHGGPVTREAILK
ncbi:MAG: prepilin-type N-terminal cleavage/methylation domain-containing protein [Verrucomicrobia bacterium]|jgi:Prokaryotic N-terminal methylation motif|nr:prepilin-type N-terminal cleavage/methylation domain-containing protein [Verrucomicrobiota bacterium]